MTAHIKLDKDGNTYRHTIEATTYEKLLLAVDSYVKDVLAQGYKLVEIKP